MAVDSRGRWHISWTWRESPDVASNHDVVYAYSDDEGRTWRRSSGEAYTLPITAATGEVAWPVPQGSELINQTSMTVDPGGHPIVATYWRAEGEEVPQFRLVWHDGERWRMSEVGRRTLPFRLSGGGTKRIPVSRPQVIAGRDGAVHVVFRDEERGGGITVATSRSPSRNDWVLRDVHEKPVGLWEPSYDPTAWRDENRLFLFHQVVGQGDGETLEDLPPQVVGVLEVSAEMLGEEAESIEANLIKKTGLSIALLALIITVAVMMIAADPLARFIEHTIPESHIYQPSALVSQFDNAITTEMDRELCTSFVTALESEDVAELSSCLYRILKTIEKIAERIGLELKDKMASFVAAEMAASHTAAAGAVQALPVDRAVLSAQPWRHPQLGTAGTAASGRTR